MSAQPIKVCFPFIGDEVGGSHISALKLVSSLDRKKINPLIVLHQNDGVLADYIRNQGMNFVGLPKLEIMAPQARRGNANVKFWSYSLKTLPALRAFIRSNGVQIVHTNDGQIHATWALAARLAGAKLIWHHRADPDAKGVNYLAPILANHIVTVSRFSRPRRPIIPVINKLSVVHSPFEHPVHIPQKQAAGEAILRELGCPAETRLIGYFGGLIDRKRPILFVDVIQKFIARYPEIPVAGLLFGENVPGGPDLDAAVRERAEFLGIADRIYAMGFRQPIDPYMAGVDIMLVPAVNEPFGRTLIESMLLGTPVIATNHGGNPEAIDDGVNGFLVEPENAEAFVQPMYALLTNKNLMRDISTVARASGLKDYGVPVHVERLTGIYQSLIKTDGVKK
jgi:glycosyltransferase involved in cell wall biosynthesis